MKINYKTILGLSLALYGILSLLNYDLINLPAKTILGISLIFYSIPSVFISFTFQPMTHKPLTYNKRNMLVLSTILFFVGIFLFANFYHVVYSYTTLILFILFSSGTIFFLLFIDNTQKKFYLYASLLLFILSYPSAKIFPYFETYNYANKFFEFANILLPVVLFLLGINIFIKRNK